MSAIGFYFRGLTRDQTNALRNRLNDLAAERGYTAAGGPTTGQGNAAQLLVAIDAGDEALIALPADQITTAIHDLGQIAANAPANHWSETVAASLRAALQRGVEAELAEIDD